jgi:DNA-binding CsgD family transcriptional regulator
MHSLIEPLFYVLLGALAVLVAFLIYRGILGLVFWISSVLRAPARIFYITAESTPMRVTEVKRSPGKVDERYWTWGNLGARQKEIALLAAQGQESAQIAKYLILSTRTVENTLYRVYGKMGVDSREELGRLLVDLGIFAPTHQHLGE